MDLGLDGKRAAVMAASQGLGRASAEALSREGAEVAICARTRETLEQTAEEISAETGNRVVPLVADVSDADQVETFIREAATSLGGLDVLVTNKGGPPPGRFGDHGDEAWLEGFELVVMSYVRAVRAALEHLQEGDGGAVVAIESTSVKRPIDGLVLSNALRPSVIAASKSLARDPSTEGVRFNVVLPGSMATGRIEDLVRSQAEEAGVPYEALMDQRLEAIPAGRLGEPAELGAMVAFLASEHAAYVDGGVFQVDGGATPNVY